MAEAQNLWAEFLEGTPPGVEIEISTGDVISYWAPEQSSLTTPDLHLYCGACSGERRFGYVGDAPATLNAKNPYAQLKYRCMNCAKADKIFIVCVVPQPDSVPRSMMPRTPGSMLVTKIGETPPFGPPVPARVITLIGADRELFLAGRRCENQGMGIGAFSYYRRVVENQKNRLISEIVRVIKATTPSATDAIAALEKAKTETQFSRAIDLTKDAIPDSLKIHGHNPLTLLHDALSNEIHAGDDATCLEIATSIRLVLTDLAERMAELLKDENELKQALNTLLQKKAAKSQPNSPGGTGQP